MKKLFFLLFLLLIHQDILSQCGAISMIGEFNGWADDVFMESDPGNPDVYTAYICFSMYDDYEGDGIISMKFRQDSSWEFNWGNTGFPAGTGVLNGPNIPVPYGCYDVSFNCSTGYYFFDLDSSGISLIGEFNGYNQDLFMHRDSAGSAHFTVEVIFDIGVDPNQNGYVDVKFRENAAWDNNWGGTTFPSGTAVWYGDVIPVPYGNYLVSFDQEILEYNFEIFIGIGETDRQGNWISIFPNPAKDISQFTLQIPQRTDVILAVYDMEGRKLSTEVDEFMEAGMHTMNLNLSGFAPGIYMYRLITRSYSESGRFVVSGY